MKPSIFKKSKERGLMVLRIHTEISSITVVSPSEHTVARINSIELRYKEERQESKAPTFALT